MQRKLTSLALVYVIVMASFAATCNKQTLISNADDVLFSLNEARPLIEQLLPGSSAKIGTAITIATKLKDAIAASQSTAAVGFISDLIPVISSIVNEDINTLTAAQKTSILAALALANIGLHYLAKKLMENGAAPQAGPQLNVIAAFNAEPVWGEAYVRGKRR